MRKFFDKLANMAKRAWNWLKGTRPARFIVKCYDRAVIATARPFLWTFYGGPRRGKVFNHRLLLPCVAALWEVILFPAALGIAAWDGLKALGRGTRKVGVTTAQWTLTVSGYAWAALSVVWTLEVAFYAWVGNTVLNAVVRPLQWAYGKMTHTTPRRWTRYRSPREALAYELSLFAPVHAGLLWLAKPAIGSEHAHRVVRVITDVVARLHPPTYDWYFSNRLPYDAPADGGDTYALIVRDDSVPETPVSEREKSANWFLSNGYILIAEPGENKTDVAVFNEYVRERWANLSAAEIATDEFGRTWVVPFKDQPLFKDVATTAGETRSYADQEMSWMTITGDKVARSHGFGRHFAAALADQDPRFVQDSSLRARERALVHNTMKQRADMHVEHILKGFDAWIDEHVAKVDA